MRTSSPRDDGWLDGRRMPVSEIRLDVGDPAVLAGVALFETIALREGRLIDLDPHLDRLERGAALLAVELPRRETLLETLGRAAEARAESHAWLKLLVTGGGRWIVLSGAMDPSEEGRPATAITLPWRHDPRDPLRGIKATCRAGYEIGRAHAKSRGADEGIWLNSHGRIAEACTGNVFVVRHRRVYTPAVGEGVLPGVVRALAIRAARDLGLEVREARLRPHRLREAHEAFLTSSLSGMRPLLAVDGRTVGGGGVGPVTRRVATRLRQLRGAGPDGATVWPRTQRGDR